MHNKYYFTLISFLILTSNIVNARIGGPPPPGPPPPPPAPLDNNLILLLVFGLLLAFFKLKNLTNKIVSESKAKVLIF